MAEIGSNMERLGVPEALDSSKLRCDDKIVLGRKRRYLRRVRIVEDTMPYIEHSAHECLRQIFKESVFT